MLNINELSRWRVLSKAAPAMGVDSMLMALPPVWLCYSLPEQNGGSNLDPKIADHRPGSRGSAAGGPFQTFSAREIR